MRSFDPESLPQNPQDDRELKSFRADNADWEAHQEGVELGAAFDKKLESYKEKLHAAFEKDEPATSKLVKEIVSQSFDKETRWLRLTVYDANNYSLTVRQVGPGGEAIEDSRKFFEEEKLPFKNVYKLTEKGVMAEPKTAKGIKALEDFGGACGLEFEEWFADVWNKNGGAKCSLPAFIEGEVSDYLLDLRTKKKTTEEDVIKKS